MISTTDIYFKMDYNIVSQNFWGISIEDKKKLIDTELKKYVISKIQELDRIKAITSESGIDSSVADLLQVLANNIPKEQHFDTLRHFIHYIIQVAGTLQNWSIIWWIKDEKELIKFPLIEFDENGVLTNLKTHEQTNYIKTFALVYEVFSNNFMTENIPKKLVMMAPKNKR